MARLPAVLPALSALVASLVLVGCATPPPGGPAAAEEARQAEVAFAKSMADRDLAAFASFVADDAVFLNGGKPLRGKAAIVEHWKRFFGTPAAPFAWAPDLVEALPDGRLAHSEGPVRGADGVPFARFYSTWRRGVDGRWQVVFDNGHELCRCPKP